MNPTGTLALHLFRADNLAKKAMLVTGATLFTTLCAKLTIPVQPVPFTLQTFAVLLCGLLLGSRLGAASQIAYFCAGLAGVPVFAEVKPAFAILASPTCGYLLGFVVAAYVVGYLAERGWDRRVSTMFLAMLIAQSVIIALGFSWFALYLHSTTLAWFAGVKPFLVVEIAKSLVLIVIMPLAWKVFGNRDSLSEPSVES